MGQRSDTSSALAGLATALDRVMRVTTCPACGGNRATGHAGWCQLGAVADRIKKRQTV
jgi:hypothetical protein